MKNKILWIINIIFVLSCIICDILLGYLVFKFNKSFYYCTLFFIIGIGIGNLIFIIVHMLINNKYKYNKFSPFLHISYVIIAGIIYYAVEFLKEYDKYYYIYWIVLLSVILIDLIVFIILMIKANKKIKTTD